ncbi:MAG: tetratricopeptide repeat protein [Treponema sp.]|nr:tetratricopeptide repeat protein [Treponema sp.]
MQKNNFPVQKRHFFSFACALAVWMAVVPSFFLTSCASTPENETEAVDVDNSKGTYEAPKAQETVSQTSTSNTISTATAPVQETTEAIKLPSASKPKSYFSKIDPEILKNVEIGSPDSLTQAMTSLRKAEAELSESEKVLIYTASEMMRILWSSQKVSWNVYDVTEETPYTGALNSVKKGIYDTSTGNTDFLSTFLPVLVFLTPNITSNVQAQCEKGLLLSLTFCPESVAANYLTGVYYEKAGLYEKSEPYLKKAYDGSHVFEILLEYAKVLSKNGKSALAEEVMKEAGGSGSNSNLQILKQNAYIAFEKGDYTAAEEYVARVLQQTPNDLEFVLFRAKIFIEKNDYIHAVSLLDMYARQNDTNIDYLILRARVQLDWSKNTNAATETIEKAMQLYPDNLDALLIAARISSVTDGPVAGKYADELAAIVLEKNPSNSAALIYALEGLVQRENWQEAYDISSRLIKSQPENEDLIFKHVTVCLKLKKNSEAMDVAKKAYNTNPSSETIIQTYVLASTQVLSRDESIKLIESMMPTASSKIKSYLYYRKSFLERSEDSALADLRSSLIANPRNCDALFRLYEIYYDKNDYRKAQYYLKQVVAINPNDSSVRKLNEALTQLIQ